MIIDREKIIDALDEELQRQLDAGEFKRDRIRRGALADAVIKAMDYTIYVRACDAVPDDIQISMDATGNPTIVKHGDPHPEGTRIILMSPMMARGIGEKLHALAV